VKHLLALMVLLAGCYPAPTTEGLCAGHTQYAVMPSTQPSPSCSGVQKAEDAADAVASDLGLSAQHTGTYLTYAEEGDGNSFAPDQYQKNAGYTAIYAQTSCADEDGRGLTKSASWDFDDIEIQTRLCHEIMHMARNCALFDHVFFCDERDDAGVCTKSHCEGWFCDNKVDQRCNAKLKEDNLTGASGGSP
jgi:hypothetical protein